LFYDRDGITQCLGTRRLPAGVLLIDESADLHMVPHYWQRAQLFPARSLKAC